MLGCITREGVTVVTIAVAVSIGPLSRVLRECVHGVTEAVVISVCVLWICICDRLVGVS